jgi:non-specific serine/threonine protein kinase
VPPPVEQSHRPAFEVSLLGPFMGSVDGHPMPRLRTRKGQWLLALLVLKYPRPVDRTWLAGVLWPDSTDAQALFNLRQCLANLRQALGTQGFRLRSASKGTLALDLAGARCDLLAFDAAMAKDDLPSLRDAVELYRGPLLEGCLEDWVFAERAIREQAHIDALGKLAEHALQTRDAREAVKYAERAVLADPLRESSVRLLMRALADSGDYAKAAEFYREIRTRLYRELQAEPESETIALSRRLREDASQAPPAARSTTRSAPPAGAIPERLTSLIGREPELAGIWDVLAQARLVTLLGPGGIGKTRLAIEIAKRAATEYPDGAWFMDLATLTDASLVEQTIADALGLRERSGTPLLEAVRDYLKSKSSVLVLDNCEHLLSECVRLATTLLLTCPGLRILATSRERLKVEGERAWRVPPLSLPPAVEGPPDGSEAVRLFVERAAAQDAAFALTRENAAPVVEICRRLDGIPLAIELAAARVGALSIEYLRARLADRLDLLTGGSRTSPSRHRTLRAAIDWSYDLLSETERRLLRRLSVFSSGWTLEAAEAICSGNGLDRDEIVEQVTSLVDKSMVAFERQRGQPRHRLLEATRSYSLDLLEEEGEAAVWRDRHSDYFLRLAEESEASAPGQSGWLDLLPPDDLRAALIWLTEIRAGEPAERGLRLAAALCNFWYFRGHLREGCRWLEKALAGSSARTAARAAALLGLGRLRGSRTGREGERRHFEEALAIYEEIGDQNGVARALYGLSYPLEAQGSADAAREMVERSLSLFSHAGSRSGVKDAYDRLGFIAFNQDDLPAARELFEKGLALAREMGDSFLSLAPLTNLGLVAYVQGDYRSAWQYHEACLATNRALDSKVDIAWCLCNLGETALAMGDVDRAGELQTESLLRFVKVDNDKGISECVRGLGQVAAARCDSSAQAKRAARLFGAAARLREILGVTILRYNRPEYERALAEVRERLGEEAFRAEWAAGLAMTFDEIIETASAAKRDESSWRTA